MRVINTEKPFDYPFASEAFTGIVRMRVLAVLYGQGKILVRYWHKGKRSMGTETTYPIKHLKDKLPDTSLTFKGMEI